MLVWPLNLEELIQNAEDAGATEVKFLYDETQYGTETLWSKDMAQYQGSALYVYNNAVFTPEDWHGIQEIARSRKKDDPLKVGRFGIGFNSVYHITDVPCIFSGDQIGMLDPHQTLFGPHESGQCWNLKDDSKEMNELPDQFAPFIGVFGSTKETFTNGSFPGTFFRFPLRLQPSQLSSNLYTKQKVLELFDSFRADADTVLLFLKSVQTVSLHVREADGTERLVFRVTASENKALKHERPNSIKILGTAISNYCKKIPSNSVTCVTYHINIVLEDESTKDAQKTSWLVCNSVGGRGISSKLDSLADELKFVPIIGLAMSLSGRDDEQNGAISDFSGKAFCFLPLPPGEESRTGLPVHISGFFGLTDNRRSIKWRELDQWRDPAALWNEFLIGNVVPKAYATLILDSIKRLETEKSSDFPLSIDAIYKLWPEASKVKAHWQPVLGPLFSELFQHAVIYSIGGEWVKLEQVYFSELDVSLEYTQSVLNYLQSSGKQIAMVPENLAAAVQLSAASATSSATPVRKVTPAWVRQVLRKCAHLGSAEEKLHLLEFVLSDQAYSELLGLELLPLQSGAFVPFSSSVSDQDVVYITSEEFPRSLFPGLEARLILENLKPHLLAALKEAAQTRGRPCTQLQLLNPERFARLIKEIMEKIPLQKLCNQIASLLPTHKDALRKFLASLTDTSEKEKRIIQELTIFKRINHSSDQGISSYTKLKGCKVLDHTAKLPADLRLSLSVIDSSDEATIRLANMLKIEKLKTTSCLKFILKDIENAFYTQEEMSQERVVAASELFDPDIEVLKDLFYSEEEAYFPPAIFTSPDILHSLRQIGLKNEASLKEKDIVQVAKTIEALQSPEGKMTLKKIKWVPAYKERPPNYPAHAVLVGSSLPLVESVHAVIKPIHDLDLQPYLYNVPKTMAKFHQLFKACGSIEELTSDHISMIPASPNTPVPIYHSKNPSKLVMKPIHECCYCDIKVDDLNDLLEDSVEPIILSGQREPLTVRIKNILEEYPSVSDIFKELLQNADDANATECSFMIDMRRNMDIRENLLDPGMAACHGPALWSFNNSEFSDSDFINITREFMIMFDPNINHISKHIKDRSNPGIKINWSKQQKRLRKFPNQFKPFIDVFGCQLPLAVEAPYSYNGTLFRLSFRTQQEAKIEESNPSLAQDTIIIKKKACPSKALSAPVLSVLKEAAKLMKTCSSSTSKKLPTEVPKSSCILQITVEEFHHVFRRIADLQSPLFRGEALKFSLNESGKRLGLVPCGAVAVLLHETQEQKWTVKPHIGEVFCYLPLRIKTGLPIHINGCFAVTSNRKEIWKTDTKGRWNTTFMRHVIVKAYLQALSVLRDLATSGFYEDIAHGKGKELTRVFSDGSTWVSMKNEIEAELRDPLMNFVLNEKLDEFSGILRVTPSSILLSLIDEKLKIRDPRAKDFAAKYQTIPFLPFLTKPAAEHQDIKPTVDLYLHEAMMQNEIAKAAIIEKLKPFHFILVENVEGIWSLIREKRQEFSLGTEFGQKEKLTSRIKSILNAYPSEKEMLKELLQNADDAKATEICFVFDPRQHPVDRIFDDKWAPLQGPALCVYNNQPFTEDDVRGIQNLGKGTKEGNPCKTGQYGIGYAPGATSVSPGRIFPLRNAEMAQVSEISSVPSSDRMVQNLLDKLRSDGAELLMFLNHMEKISICEIDKATGGLNVLYSVKGKITDGDRLKRKQFHASVIDSVTKKRQLKDIPVQQITYTMDTEDSEGNLTTWLICNRSGFSSMDKTGLPFHVNGHFALDSARRNLWRDDNGVGVRINRLDLQPDLYCLVKALYCCIHEDMKRLLPVDELQHLKNADYNITTRKTVAENVYRLKHLLLEIGFNLVYNFDYCFKDAEENEFEVEGLPLLITLDSVLQIFDVAKVFDISSFADLLSSVLPREYKTKNCTKWKDNFARTKFTVSSSQLVVPEGDVLIPLSLMHIAVFPNAQSDKVTEKLVESDFEALLMYFNCNLSHLMSQDDIKILKSLPCYKSISGRYMSIARFGTCYVLTKIDDLEVYLKHLLPKIENLSYDAKLEHLIYLKNRLSNIEELSEIKEQLFEKLESLLIIHDANNRLKQAKHFYDRTQQLLQFAKEISYQEVINNCRNICNITTLDEEMLRGVAFVMVEDGWKLLKPEEVVINLEYEADFKPYLYKLPLELGTFHQLFKHLGTEDIISTKQYAEVLSRIFKNSEGKQLDPNEMRTVKRVVSGLFKSLQNDSVKVRSDLENARDLVLYLPSQDVDLSQCYLGKDHGFHTKLIMLFPQKLRPRLLSSILEEQLDEETPKFITGLIRIMKHENDNAFLANEEKAIRLCKALREGLKVSETFAFLKRFGNAVILLISEKLDSLGVKYDSSEPSKLELPMPGTPIPAEIHYTLLMDPMNVFYPGEYVGYLVDAEGKIYQIDIGYSEYKIVSSLDLESHKSSSSKHHSPKKLKNEINRLEKQAFLDQNADRASRRTFSASASRFQSDKYSFQRFYTSWNQEATSHKSERQQQSKEKCPPSAGQTYSQRFFVPPTFKSVGNPVEARRWLRQARANFSAARNDLHKNANEWVCFKCYLSTKLALIAADYAVRGKSDKDVKPTALAQKIEEYSQQLEGLTNDVHTLEAYGVDSLKTRYPDLLPFPQIPNDRFTSEVAMRVLECTACIIIKLENFIQQKLHCHYLGTVKNTIECARNILKLYDS
ncbi:sacsin [Cricetulus griseus]|nr:sacsin [Cricetulus griseus]